MQLIERGVSIIARRVSERISDARVAEDVLSFGETEFREGFRRAVDAVNSIDELGDVHTAAVVHMLRVRKDLADRVDRMNNKSVVYRDDPFYINPVLATVDRIRERAAGLKDIVFGDYRG